MIHWLLKASHGIRASKIMYVRIAYDIVLSSMANFYEPN